MNIKLISVGKIKQDYFKKAIDDYVQRINKFFKFIDIAVDDEPEPNNISQKSIDLIKQKESFRILKHINANDFVVGLIIEGKSLDSIQLANQINDVLNSSYSSICFIIGGSNGLHQTIYDRCNLQLSMSKMTFAHNLAKVILLEQIYRSLNIIKKTKYHK